MKIKRIASFVALFAVSVAAFTLFSNSTASAATCTWQSTAPGNMSNPANWTGCTTDGSDAFPEDGDSLVFPAVASPTVVVNNDLTNIDLADIIFTSGTTNYTISGNLTNSFTITDDIDNSGAAEQTINVPLVISGSVDFRASSGFLTIGGVVSGTGALVTEGNFQVSLLGNNTYTGTTTVASGVTRIMHINGLGAAGVGQGTTVDDSATLEFAGLADGAVVAEPLTLNGAGFSGRETVAVVRGTGDLSDEITFSGTISLAGADIEIGSNGPLVLSGIISGSFGLVFTNDISADDTAVLKVTASNTYTGGTTIEETMVVTGNLSSSVITVSDGATLKGTGTVGILSIEDGGTLAPGLSPGCLTAGDTIFDAGAIFAVEIGGTTSTCPGAQFDRLIVNGDIDLGGATLNVVLFGGFVPSVGQSFVIIDSTDPLSNTFAGLAEGATFVSQGVTYRVNYDNAAGTVTLTVTAVDPAVAAAAAPGAPNTGFGLVAAHPLVSLAISTLAAASIMVIARRLKPARQQN